MRRKQFYLSIGLLLFAAIALSACGDASAEPADSYADDAYWQAGDTVDDTAAEASNGEGSGVDASPSLGPRRLVIMSANMVIETQDAAFVIQYATDMAARYGGYVVSSNVEHYEDHNGEEGVEGSITIRVLSPRLNAALQEIENLDLKIISKDQSGQDVTKEYTDLESRLQNLEDAADQLRVILDQSTGTDEVLDVYRELTKVTEEAEVIRGQMQYYEEASSLSAITIIARQTVEEPEPTPTPTPTPWGAGPAFERSKERLSTSLQRWVDGTIHFFVFVLPMLTLRLGPWLLIFFFIGRWAYRRFWRKDKEKADPAPPESK